MDPNQITSPQPAAFSTSPLSPVLPPISTPLPVSPANPKSKLPFIISLVIIFLLISGAAVYALLNNQSSKVASCVEECPGNDGVLRSCHPAESDGSSTDSICTTTGRTEVCGGKTFCCPSSGGRWTYDMSACPNTSQTPATSDIVETTPQPTNELTENFVKCNIDGNNLDFKITSINYSTTFDFTKILAYEQNRPTNSYQPFIQITFPGQDVGVINDTENTNKIRLLYRLNSTDVYQKTGAAQLNVTNYSGKKYRGPAKDFLAELDTPKNIPEAKTVTGDVQTNTVFYNLDGIVSTNQKFFNCSFNSNTTVGLTRDTVR